MNELTKTPENGDKEEIINVVSTVFSGADERDWIKVQSVMSASVLLDYSSMNGSEPVYLAPDQITGAWAAFLPGFDRTHHQLRGFDVKIDGKHADVSFSGRADHYIDNEVWTVEGTYDAHIEFTPDGWKLSMLKFNFKNQDGNTGLPAIAAERASAK